MARRVQSEDPGAEPTAQARSAASGSGEGSGAATTRERILDVALDLFIRKTYAETSLREIAAEMGFSKAALYYHFESKQDILLALHMRLHDLTEGVLPLLPDGVDTDGAWEQFVDRLIGFALQHRRLLEMHFRNQEAIADLHRDVTLPNHGRVLHGQVREHDLENHVLGLLRDPAAPLAQRVRRVASLGAIAGVLLASGALADVPDAELESALREVVHGVLTDRHG